MKRILVITAGLQLEGVVHLLLATFGYIFNEAVYPIIILSERNYYNYLRFRDDKSINCCRNYEHGWYRESIDAPCKKSE